MGLRVDWGDALVLPTFYGREEEQALLFQWVVQERCRVVSVLGMGGIGKSALVVSLTQRLVEGTGQVKGVEWTKIAGQVEGTGYVEDTIQAKISRKAKGAVHSGTGNCPFEVVIFRLLRNAPSCEELLDDCLQVLSPRPLRIVPVGLERRINLLLEYMREMRVLIVLDNLEGLLEPGDVRGHFRPGFEGYEKLLHRVVECGHQSCLLVTSREKPAELRLLESRYSQVRSLRLAGLDIAACKMLLEEKGIASGVGPESKQEHLIEVYGGNPLALKIVSETIIDLFAGNIDEFLAGDVVVVFGSITGLLEEQFARLSALEQGALCWLAIVREPVVLGELLALLVTPLPCVQILEAVDSLRRRSLIEGGKRLGSFTLQSVVLEYVTSVLLAEASSEIQQGRLYRLREHGLEQAQASEYVRQTQERLLVRPLLAELLAEQVRRDRALCLSPEGRNRTGAGPIGPPQGVLAVSLEGQLLGLLDQLRGESDSAQGYGPANLIALLRVLRGHLSGLDLSHLSIRGAYLQGIRMQDASLTGARVRDTTFTEAISAAWAVAISPDGKWWAAGSVQGKVRVWEGVRSQTLRLMWQAHTDQVITLAFSSDGRTLASGGLDGTIKLWDVDTGTLLWINWQSDPVSLAFTPDGSLLASAGTDATVRLWDPQSGKNLQVLAHPSQVYAVAWSPDGHLLASGGTDGTIRLWERQKTLLSTYIETQVVQSIWVISLAFAPDGRTLASGHWNHTVKLWEIGSLRQLRTLSGHADRANYVAWSPNGRLLASCNEGNTISLWDVERGSCRAVLHGHTADVNGIVFTPGGNCLLSSSEDSTLRVWDVESSQCMRVITGYAVSLYCVDWSPDGKHLVSGDTGGLVTIWNLSGAMPPRDLYSHSWVVSGVGWSSDDRFLTSCGWDRVVRLWDPALRTSVQMFEDPSTLLLSMALSPDGRLLACGTYLRGVQVWDVRARSLRWVGQPHLVPFYSVAWSPDGTRLVSSGGDGDGIVYLWEGPDGIGQVQSAVPTRLLMGHHDRAMSVVWSPDGRFLASGSGNGGNGELFVWDVRSGERMGTFTGHLGRVSALAWACSQAGTGHGLYGFGEDRLVSGGSDGTLRWWDVKTGECMSIREAHQGTIRSLRVSPDGRQLASCGDDGTIMIWDLESTEHLLTLRRDRPYERLNVTGIEGLTEAQKAVLHALGAIEETAS